MSSATAGIRYTISQRLSGAMEDCSIVRGRQLQTLCHQRCCVSASRCMCGSVWNAVAANEHRQQDVWSIGLLYSNITDIWFRNQLRSSRQKFKFLTAVTNTQEACTSNLHWTEQRSIRCKFLAHDVSWVCHRYYASQLV